MNERTDSDLLRDYSSNACEAAFSELVRRYLALVYSVALRVVVDPHLAEDVTQATFSILAREARHLAGRAFLSSWLHRTASNQAANLVRSEMRRRAREQEAYTMQTEPTGTATDWKQVAPRLDAALNQLAEADRTVILLRFFEKKTAADIAARLSLSEDAAQKRVSRALNRLRGLLFRQGAALSAATLGALITTRAVVAAPAGLSTSVLATALASGTVGGGIAIPTLKLVAMSKLKISAMGALILATVATPLVIQHQRLARLREENQLLQDRARQAGNLRVENENLSAQLADAKQRPGLSEAQLSELVRLRSEVGSLRRDRQELVRLRAQTQGERPAAPPAEEAIEKFEAHRAEMVNALKILGMQLRSLLRDNNVQAAIAPDGSLEPGLLSNSLSHFDIKQVELLVNDPSQFRKLLDEAPGTIIARTAEPMATPDGHWVRVYSLADGSVQVKSTDNPDEAFEGNWHLGQVKQRQ